MAIRGRDGYIAKFLPGENYYIAIFPGGFCYIAIFRGKMARGKNYYTTPVH